MLGTKERAPRRHTPGRSHLSGRRSGRLNDVGRLWTLLALNDLELDAIAFSQRLESGPLDCAEVDKHVGAAITRNETKAFRVVEPLHYAVDACHETFPRPELGLTVTRILWATQT